MQIAEVALPDGSVCVCGVVQHEANAFVSVLGSKVHTAPIRLVPVTADAARLRAVHLPDHVPVAGETLEVIIQASDASGAILDMEDVKVVAEMVLKSERGAFAFMLLLFNYFKQDARACIAFKCKDPLFPQKGRAASPLGG